MIPTAFADPLTNLRQLRASASASASASGEGWGQAHADPAPSLPALTQGLAQTERLMHWPWRVRVPAGSRPRHFRGVPRRSQIVLLVREGRSRNEAAYKGLYDLTLRGVWERGCTSVEWKERGMLGPRAPS